MLRMIVEATEEVACRSASTPSAFLKASRRRCCTAGGGNCKDLCVNALP
jgi:hypothetical protein